MKAPITMWIDGVQYHKGSPIPKELTRTAKVLLEVHERIVRPAHPGTDCYCDWCNMTDGAKP